MINTVDAPTLPMPSILGCGAVLQAVIPPSRSVRATIMR